MNHADMFASRLTSLYELFLFSLTGRYLSIVAPGVAPSPQAASRFKVDAHRFAKTFMSAATNEINDFIGLKLTDNANQVPGSITVRSRQLIASMQSAITENVAGLEKKVQIGTAAKAIRSGGVFGLLFQKRLEQPVFKITDSSGRSWVATILMKTMLRDFAYQAQLDMDLSKITDDLAQVIYPRLDHQNDGLVFSISGKTKGYPSLDSIREAIFHPNSTAEVKQYVPT